MKQLTPLISKDYIAPTVILADGSYPESGVAGAILSGCGFVVCCDGAADEFVRRGGFPAAIVGDLDSVSQSTAQLYGDIMYGDADQETNDLTKAVMYCVSLGRTDIVILGASGKREDHTIGNISLLADYMDVARVRMVTDYGIFTPIERRTMFESFPGQQVTIVSFDPQARVTTIGLKYPLHDACLRLWWQGTLNESLGSEFGFDVSGKAVVFQGFVVEKNKFQVNNMG